MAEKEDGAASGPENKDEVIAKLSEQVENLNKGVATYRDEAKSAKAEAAEAKAAAAQASQKLSELEKLSEKRDDGVKLTPAEEAKLEAYAQKHGLVSKQDLEEQRSKALADQAKAYESQAVAEFLDKHPEYDDDDQWKKVAREFAIYRPPATLQGYRELLDRIHKGVSGEADKAAAAKARADVINRSKLNIGGGAGKAGEGDAEAELDRLAKKYPRLTREQILDRLSEIRALPAKNKK